PAPRETLPMTPCVQRALDHAAEEAERVHAECVGTEYLLLGLLHDPEGVAAQVLNGLGLGLDAARRAVGLLRAVEQPPGPAAGEEPAGPADGAGAAFTARGRRVLRCAQEEARRYGHDQVGPEHLFLALFKEGQGLAARVLTGLGLDFRAARLVIERLVPAGVAAIPSGRLPLT